MIVTKELGDIAKAFPALPPEEQAEVLSRLGKMPELVDQVWKEALASIAVSKDSPEGYAAFYELIHGNKPPAHVMREIRQIYQSHAEGVGTLIFAWRGSWKTTSISETFTAFRIGHEPDKTNIAISANDDSATKITKAVAQIIENNPGWKLAFPNVIPYTERGWSAEGYWVRDKSYTLEDWAKKQSAVIDPTLLGGGYKSSRIIGKHPTGILVIDDIHDRDNSISQLEREGVVDILTKTILKTVVKEKDALSTWLVAVGTPWALDDAYYAMKNTGQFNFVNIPAMYKSQEGEGVYIDGVNRNGAVFEDIVGWWKLEWPERFGIKSIIFERSQGKPSFWQMIMLDLAQAKTGGLRYYLYDHTKLQPSWMHSGGCDFATLDLTGKPDPGRDKFSMCVGSRTPDNQAVASEGVIKQCTQAEAEGYLQSAYKNHTNWRNGWFEGDGAGEQFFIAFYRRNPGIKWIMEKTGGVSKRYRQEQQLGPWLENGFVLISDEDTPYLTELRKALDDFPDGNNDIRDGLYWFARAFPEVLQGYNRTDEVSTRRQQAGLYSPWSGTKAGNG